MPYDAAEFQFPPKQWQRRNSMEHQGCEGQGRGYLTAFCAQVLACVSNAAAITSSDRQEGRAEPLLPSSTRIQAGNLTLSKSPMIQDSYFHVTFFIVIMVAIVELIGRLRPARHKSTRMKRLCRSTERKPAWRKCSRDSTNSIQVAGGTCQGFSHQVVSFLRNGVTCLL